MTSSRIRKVAATGQIRGEVDLFGRLLDALTKTDADAIALVGDLGAPWSKADTYRAIFKALGEAGLPAFWVPGPTDAPLREYLSECYNLETVYPFLHGVHGTVATGAGGVLFAGIGGEIADDPKAVRAEEALLRYPGWEVEYRLKVVDEFDHPQKVFLFTTQPAHKGLGEPGSEVLAELIKTHRPRVAIVAGEDAAEEHLGTTLVVSPGRVDRGEYALVDLQDRSVARAVLAEPEVAHRGS
jgi:Icc-related predicted phosphoesterase